MKTIIGFNLKNNFWQRIFQMLTRKKEPEMELSVAEVVTKEIDALWSVVRDQEIEERCLSDFYCGKKILESFNGLKEKFSDEELDNVHTWIRYVKVAVHCENPPVEALIKHVSADNYISLTKRLSDLKNSVCKKGDENAISNIEKLYELVCRHILDNINPKDIPSCLSLGRAAQKRKEYAEARMWFTRVMETETPFNGLTSLLACYEAETKELLSENRRIVAYDTTVMEKVRELNEQQAAIYDKWSNIIKGYIESGDELAEQYRKEYVSLLTGYSRFERNRGNYKKAYELLEKIPRTFPDMHRVYKEEAMLYQFKPYKNRYYSLDKAIETFQKAYVTACGESDAEETDIKGKKSILMPLANTYFQSGRYDEADEICDRVLKIDRKEQKAISMKLQIAHLAS